jgi:hypothetical protein
MTEKSFTIVEAPSVLGLFPRGVETLPDALLAVGLAERLGAGRTGRVEPLPYKPERDPETLLLNPHAIAAYSIALADAVGAVVDRGEVPVVLGGDCSMSETDFLRALARRSGCGLLLDVNNVFVSATNQGYSPADYLADFPLSQVGEIHLAGHSEQADDEGELLLIDSHDRKIADPVWTLFESVVAQCGPVPTLVEWDSSIPEWPMLRAEAEAAQAILDRHAPVAWRSANAGR